MNTKAFVIILAGVAALEMSGGAAHAQSVTSRTAVNQNIQQQTVAPQRAYTQGVSTGKIVGPGRATTPPLPGTTADALFGEAAGQPVLPPTTKNTFYVKAEYLYPDPKNESAPFLRHSSSARMPNTNKGNLFWTPNQGSVIVNR